MSGSTTPNYTVVNLKILTLNLFHLRCALGPLNDVFILFTPQRCDIFLKLRSRHHNQKIDFQLYLPSINSDVLIISSWPWCSWDSRDENIFLWPRPESLNPEIMMACVPRSIVSSLQHLGPLKVLWSELMILHANSKRKCLPCSTLYPHVSHCWVHTPCWTDSRTICYLTW